MPTTPWAALKQRRCILKEILVLFPVSLIGCVEHLHLPDNITLNIAIPAQQQDKIYEIIQQWIRYNTHINDIDIATHTTYTDKTTGKYKLNITCKIGQIPHWSLFAHFKVSIQIHDTHVYTIFQFLESIVKNNSHIASYPQLRDQHYPHAILNGYGVTEHTIIKTIKMLVDDLKKYIHAEISSI